LQAFLLCWQRRWAASGYKKGTSWTTSRLVKWSSPRDALVAFAGISTLSRRPYVLDRLPASARELTRVPKLPWGVDSGVMGYRRAADVSPSSCNKRASNWRPGAI